jgi:circadian clock protein KaiC
VAIAELEAKGLVTFAWRSPSETMLDREAHDLVSLVREKKIQRLALDGFPGFRGSDERDRMSSAFAAISNELARSGVTTFVTDETRELFVRDVHVPTSNVSALFHNIIFLRQVETSAALTLLIGILKTRDSTHDPRLWELENGSQGLRVVRPFAATERGLMRGGDGSDA